MGKLHKGMGSVIVLLSRGSYDEFSLNAKWPQTLIPSQPTWIVSPPVGCHHLHPPLPFIIITHPES